MPTSTSPATSTFTSEGHVTLPEEIREHLHLKAGDRVEFRIEPDGKVEVRPASASIDGGACGILHRPGMRPTSVEEMDEAIGRHLAEDDERIQKGGKGWA